MNHTHTFRPIWLLITSPAWYDHYHRIVTYARCTRCGTEAVLAGWQSPRHLHGRLAEEGT